MATLDLKQFFGMVYHRIILQLGGTFTKSQITEIRIKANGKLIFQDSGSRIDLINQYKGLAASATLLTIDFTEPRMRDQFEQLMGGLDTGKDKTGMPKVSSLLMEIDIAGATNPTLVAYLDCGYQDTQVEKISVDLIGKRLLFSFPVSATASRFPLQIPYGAQGGSLIKRIHLVGSNNNITVNGVVINKDSAPIFDLPLAVNQFVQAEFQRTPQASLFTVDFIVDMNMNANILNAANAASMEYYADITVTTPGNLTAIVELLDPLLNN